MALQCSMVNAATFGVPGAATLGDEGFAGRLDVAASSTARLQDHRPSQFHAIRNG
jgi:hypothetical protein